MLAAAICRHACSPLRCPGADKWLAPACPAGGPFETRKRRFMNPLLYLEVALWFLLLCFTSEHPADGSYQLAANSSTCTPLPRLPLTNKARAPAGIPPADRRSLPWPDPTQPDPI